MIGLLALLFVVVPIAELYVIVQVAGGIGVPETILLMIGMSVLGAWLAKWQGFSVLYRVQAAVIEGRVPSGELVDGALIVLAGALMITPGFLSDCMAIVLLLPPTRAAVRGVILRRIRAGGGLITVVSGTRGWGGPTRRTAPSRGRPDGVVDADSWEDPPADPPRPELDR
jgi:UPF0716 protein FxsA